MRLSQGTPSSHLPYLCLCGFYTNFWDDLGMEKGHALEDGGILLGGDSAKQRSNHGLPTLPHSLVHPSPADRPLRPLSLGRALGHLLLSCWTAQGWALQASEFRKADLSSA